MIPNTSHETLEESIHQAVLTERRRCVCIVLTTCAACKQDGQDASAHILDVIATHLEHPDVGDLTTRFR